MSNKRSYAGGALLALIATFPAGVCADSSLLLRPQAGYGVVDVGGETVSHAGVRLLLNAGGIRRYGLEATRFETAGDDYTSIGIVLEQRLWGWFNMSIGSVGYFGYGAASQNPIGLMTNLGWEPDSRGAIKPFVTYRNDFVFADDTAVSHSLSAGLTIPLQ